MSDVLMAVSLSLFFMYVLRTVSTFTPNPLLGLRRATRPDPATTHASTASWISR